MGDLILLQTGGEERPLEDMLHDTERALITLPADHPLRPGLVLIRRGLLAWLGEAER